MKGIGILVRDYYADHIVPLCQILNFPLLVTRRWEKEWIEFYYPPMEIILHEEENDCLDDSLNDYDTLVYVDPFRMAHGHFFFGDYFTRKKMRSIYSMHGNSDKKWNAYWIEKLADEDIILLYGNHSVDFLKQKGVEKPYILCGNYRLEFYRKHKEFFDKKFFYEKEKKTVLYAPTWISKDKKSEFRFEYSSLFEAYSYVFDHVPEDIQLLVKLHPLQKKMMAGEVEELKDNYPHIHFIEDFPLVFPLLEKVDVYLGDFSSVGYDFLYYQRPMFFLHVDETTYLQKCGLSLSKDKMPRLYSIIDARQNPFAEQQKKVFSYAFGEEKSLSHLREEIYHACK